MLDANEISKLMWQCAIVHTFRDEVHLNDRELKVLQAMRYYFRADERPPESLAVRALAIVTMFKAYKKDPGRRSKIIMRRRARQARLEAIQARPAAVAQPAPSGTTPTSQDTTHPAAFEQRAILPDSPPA